MFKQLAEDAGAVVEHFANEDTKAKIQGAAIFAGALAGTFATIAAISKGTKNVDPDIIDVDIIKSSEKS